MACYETKYRKGSFKTKYYDPLKKFKLCYKIVGTFVYVKEIEPHK
jgi:hypothetical protein